MMPAPAFNCEGCQRTIDEHDGHYVTRNHRIVCAHCLTEKYLHREWFPDCREPWHDLMDHMLYIGGSRMATAVVLGLVTPVAEV